MSRDLPPNPNLEHLKKQAKALLDAAQQQNANATLADAQHVLAREYGFLSWPKLKAHIGKSPIPKPAALFDRFTMVLRQALFFSRFEASSLGRLRIRPEHVLLGIIRSEGRSSRDLFKTTGVTLDDARAKVVVADEPREVIVEPVQIPFQDATKALFTAAAAEADGLGHQKIATAHVVLALMREESAASSFLRSRGVTLEATTAAAAMAESPSGGEDS